ncbi:hypothetical protein AK812_SmicGene1738 [Symbiodinium microadriaticum]|uniref:Uncharacterized protein n=1 Tax=Symbiodinium microadriaticum TaxID=2951 RepID=A0A1Q9F3C3_SYMMI|nr:hypothetical protein AK812_SmicGene1738 [Symbiodinium microadriaticum]
MVLQPGTVAVASIITGTIAIAWHSFDLVVFLLDLVLGAGLTWSRHEHHDSEYRYLFSPVIIWPSEAKLIHTSGKAWRKPLVPLDILVSRGPGSSDEAYCWCDRDSCLCALLRLVLHSAPWVFGST